MNQAQDTRIADLITRGDAADGVHDRGHTGAATATSTCREIFRKPDPQFADITVIGVACPDVDTAIAESVRIGREQGRAAYNRSFKAKGKLVTRYTVYKDDLEISVYVQPDRVVAK